MHPCANVGRAIRYWLDAAHSFTKLVGRRITSKTPRILRYHKLRTIITFRENPGGTETIIYIRLLNEGTDVWRPVDSLPVGDGLYRIAPASWPLTDEIWEFQPGSVVQCAEKQLSTGTHLVATKSIGTKETEQGGDGDAEEAV